MLMRKENMGHIREGEKVFLFSTFFFNPSTPTPITLFTWPIAKHIHRSAACFLFGFTLHRRNTKKDLCSNQIRKSAGQYVPS